jgi:hypothetical protein
MASHLFVGLFIGRDALEATLDGVTDKADEVSNNVVHSPTGARSDGCRSFGFR